MLKEDVWSINSPLNPLEPLEKHLSWLREQLEPHINYLSHLSTMALLRVYLGFTLSQEQNASQSRGSSFVFLPRSTPSLNCTLFATSVRIQTISQLLQLEDCSSGVDMIRLLGRIIVGGWAIIFSCAVVLVFVPKLVGLIPRSMLELIRVFLIIFLLASMTLGIFYLCIKGLSVVRRAGRKHSN